MKQVDITLDMIDNARQKASEMGRLNNSIYMEGEILQVLWGSS